MVYNALRHDACFGKQVGQALTEPEPYKCDAESCNPLTKQKRERLDLGYKIQRALLLVLEETLLQHPHRNGDVRSSSGYDGWL